MQINILAFFIVMVNSAPGKSEQCSNFWASIDHIDYSDMNIADMESLIESVYNQFHEEMTDQSSVKPPTGVNTPYNLRQMFM